MLLAFTSLWKDEKVIVDFSKVVKIEAYSHSRGDENFTGHRLTYGSQWDSHEVHVKETIDQICEKVNEMSRGKEHSITIWHRQSKF